MRVSMHKWGGGKTLNLEVHVGAKKVRNGRKHRFRELLREAQKLAGIGAWEVDAKRAGTLDGGS